MRETRKCAICGKEFIPRTYNAKYCSAECKYEVMEAWKRDYYNRELKKPDGIKRGKRGLLYEKKGSVPRRFGRAGQGQQHGCFPAPRQRAQRSTLAVETHTGMQDREQ